MGRCVLLIILSSPPCLLAFTIAACVSSRSCLVVVRLVLRLVLRLVAFLSSCGVVRFSFRRSLVVRPSFHRPGVSFPPSRACLSSERGD